MLRNLAMQANEANMSELRTCAKRVKPHGHDFAPGPHTGDAVGANPP